MKYHTKSNWQPVIYHWLECHARYKTVPYFISYDIDNIVLINEILYEGKHVGVLHNLLVGIKIRKSRIVDIHTF